MAEWLAYQMLALSNVPKELQVPYHLAELVLPNDERSAGCYSEDFLQPGERLVTLQRLMNAALVTQEDLFSSYGVEGRIRSTLEFIKENTGLSWLEEYFSILLAFDAFILNEDRHFNNIAFIQTADGGWRHCPLFDHGLSFLSDTNDYPLRYSVKSNVMSVNAKPFSNDFLQQARVLKDVYPLKFDADGIFLLLEENREQLGRVYDVVKLQIERYPWLF
ncbi:HipA domain-containing protein [Paenibacillus jiagnxiensis]|uniref:hypothetical protein n=1 Tax=Paenibacillus jiagnxiensis TaxID=3228926 RepID=UPI0038D3F917